MGCGNSKDTVNTNAHGKGKVGSDKNGNIKNSQDFKSVSESNDVMSSEQQRKIDDQSDEKSKGGKGRGHGAKTPREPKEPREPVNEKGYKGKPQKEIGYLKRIRQHLREAATGSDIEELEQAVLIFEKNKLEDNGDRTDALERLKFLYLRKELRDAILRRHPEVLDRAISRVESSDYRSELSHSLESAKRLREHLTELDQYRHDILTMDQLTISEIRSYHHPPDGVHEIMMGTYMLLGYEEEKLKDWTDVQCLLGRYGKESLIREVRNADTININSKTSQRVLNMQSKFSLEQIRSVSNGAATFYVWNDKMANKSDKDRQEPQTSQTPTPGKQSGKNTPAPGDSKQNKPNSNKPQSNSKEKQPPKGQQPPKANKQTNSNPKDKNPSQPKPKDQNKANDKPKDKKPAQQPAKDKNPVQPNAKDKNPTQPNNPAQPNAKDKNLNPQGSSDPDTKNKTAAQPVQPNSKNKTPTQPNAKDANKIQSSKQTEQTKTNVNTANQKNQVQQNSNPTSSTITQPNTKSKSDAQQATTDRKKTKG
ncbi:protein piccolo-like isoform X1 [Crassostrea angulata]|uniref:protein piccolo-like isoform X1 n=1 Tax=Magallana angulata TaxID=2784310 RepID=UPI0022B10DBB|nr:protein piccolo-like isoform X1 [Crassostrea angulata]